MLTTPEIILIVIILGVLALIISNRLRADLVALLALLALAFTNLVPPTEAISGFSSSAVITIVGLFIITQGLENTGVVQWIANQLRRMGGGSETRLVVLFMAAGALLSLIMNNIAAGAVLLPAAIQVCRDSDVRASKVLIPLSFGTLVGGMATYFTTANIIVSSILIDQQQHGLNMMDFLPVGSLIIVLALVFMATLGRRMLPARDSVGQNISPRSLSRALSETYHLAERLWEVEVPRNARLVNTDLYDSHIGELLGITVVAIWRGGHAVLAPTPHETIQAGDYLLVLGREDRVQKLAEWGLSVGRQNTNGRHSYAVDLTEVVIPPRSTAIGKTLKDLRFRNKFGLTSVALWREGRSYRTDVGTFPLEVGDALLMVGATNRIKSLSQERDYLVLESSHIHQPPRPERANWALLVTALVLAVAILSPLPLPLVMLAGAAAMVLSGSVSLDEAYRGIEWRVVFLIAGMLPLSIAMTNTGLAARIGDIISSLAPFGPVILIATLFTLTMLITQVIGGQVSALLVGPIAISAALQAGVNPQAVGVVVAIACSTAFLTPIAHPVNVLMMGPGGYTFTDFFKVGLCMTIVTFAGLLLGLTIFWGL